MTTHAEFAPELRKMAARVLEMAQIEKGSSDAKYALNSAHSYLSQAAAAIERLSQKPISRK